MHSKRCILGADNVVNGEEYNQLDELPPFTMDMLHLQFMKLITLFTYDHNTMKEYGYHKTAYFSLLDISI